MARELLKAQSRLRELEGTAWSTPDGEHYRDAERLLEQADGVAMDHAMYLLLGAQVHATLATVPTWAAMVGSARRVPVEEEGNRMTIKRKNHGRNPLLLGRVHEDGTETKVPGVTTIPSATPSPSRRCRAGRPRSPRRTPSRTGTS